MNKASEYDSSNKEEIESYGEIIKELTELGINDTWIEKPKIREVEEVINEAQEKPAERYQGVWEFEKAIANAKLKAVMCSSTHKTKRRDYEDWMIERGYLTEEERFLGRLLDE